MGDLSEKPTDGCRSFSSAAEPLAMSVRELRGAQTFDCNYHNFPFELFNAELLNF